MLSAPLKSTRLRCESFAQHKTTLSLLHIARRTASSHIPARQCIMIQAAGRTVGRSVGWPAGRSFGCLWRRVVLVTWNVTREKCAAALTGSFTLTDAVRLQCARLGILLGRLHRKCTNVFYWPFHTCTRHARIQMHFNCITQPPALRCRCTLAHLWR